MLDNSRIPGFGAATSDFQQALSQPLQLTRFPGAIRDLPGDFINPLHRSVDQRDALLRLLQRIGASRKESTTAVQALLILRRS